MKNIICGFAFAFSLLISPVVMACPDTQKEAEAFYHIWAEAIDARDAAKVTALYKPDAILLATLNNEPLRDQKTRLTYFTGLLKKTGFKVTPQATYTQPLGCNVAVVSGTYTFSFEYSKNPVSVPARFNFVMEKDKGGNWLIANHHSSKLPLKN